MKSGESRLSDWTEPTLCHPSRQKSTREVFEWRNAFEHVPRVLMVVADDGQGGDDPEGGHPNGLRVLTHLQNLTEALLALSKRHARIHIPYTDTDTDTHTHTYTLTCSP